MTRMRGFFLAAMALCLSACNDGGSDRDEPPVGPVVSVDDLSTGVYTVSVGDPSQPTVGKYFAAGNGQRWLVLENRDAVGDRLYRRSDNQSGWVAVPPVAVATQVTLLNSDPRLSAPLSLNGLAGSYVVQVTPGTLARFSLTADGALVAGATTCKLSGKLTPGEMPGAADLRLSSSGCGNFPASGSGILALDEDAAPARFRLIGDNGSVVFDLWGFRE